MTMNIYITKENEKFLRSLNTSGVTFVTGSMSGLINKLLNDYRNGEGPDLFPPVDSKAYISTKPIKTHKNEDYDNMKIDMGTSGKLAADLAVPVIKSPSEATQRTSKPEIIKTSKDAEKAVYSMPAILGDDLVKFKRVGKEITSIKLCKIHSTPLTEEGKCLQKGCKYA